MTDGYVDYHKEVGIHMESSVWAAMYSIFVYICCVFLYHEKNAPEHLPLDHESAYEFICILERRLYHYGLQN